MAEKLEACILMHTLQSLMLDFDLQASIRLLVQGNLRKALVPHGSRVQHGPTVKSPSRPYSPKRLLTCSDSDHVWLTSPFANMCHVCQLSNIIKSINHPQRHQAKEHFALDFSCTTLASSQNIHQGGLARTTGTHQSCEASRVKDATEVLEDGLHLEGGIWAGFNLVEASLSVKFNCNSKR